MMFAVFRAGIHIPVPGVDASVIESLFTSGNLFGLLDLFAGGALSKVLYLCNEYYPLHQCFHHHATASVCSSTV